MRRLLLLLLVTGCVTTVRSKQPPDVPATFPMRADTVRKP